MVTGEHFSLGKSKVSRYNIDGWVEDLDDLLSPRRGHACTRYLDQGVFVNLVCGGLDSVGERFSSCEINLDGDSSWSYASPLPEQIWFLRGITIDNRVLMTGTQLIFTSSLLTCWKVVKSLLCSMMTEFLNSTRTQENGLSWRT